MTSPRLSWMSVKAIHFIKWVLENIVGPGALHRYWNGNYCMKILQIISGVGSKKTQQLENLINEDLQITKLMP